MAYKQNIGAHSEVRKKREIWQFDIRFALPCLSLFKLELCEYHANGQELIEQHETPMHKKQLFYAATDV
jgi:hypothetical protein